MEKEIKIRISKRKYIYGKLRGLLTHPLVIFVHGLAGDMDEHIFFNGARYFEKHGFSCFRFNLYRHDKDARKMGNCTIKTHSHDLDLVIKYFRKKGVKKVFIVGHSYGGPTILLSKNKDYDGIVLWDPSYNLRELFTKTEYIRIKEFNDYVVTWGYGIIVGRKMVEEARKITGRQSEQMIQNIHTPIKIICAEKKKIMLKGGKRYYAAANKPKSFIVIKNATHCFDEDGVEEKLFSQTLSWFKKYKK